MLFTDMEATWTNQRDELVKRHDIDPHPVLTVAVEPGVAVPPFERTTGFHDWNRYAAVNDEFVDIHMDDGAGQAAGYTGAFGMGNLQWAYMHNMLREWIGGDGRIVRVACQFRGPNLRDTVATAHGTVTAVRRAGDETEVDLDVWTETPTAPRSRWGRPRSRSQGSMSDGDSDTSERTGIERLLSPHSIAMVGASNKPSIGGQVFANLRRFRAGPVHPVTRGRRGAGRDGLPVRRRPARAGRPGRGRGPGRPGRPG